MKFTLYCLLLATMMTFTTVAKSKAESSQICTDEAKIRSFSYPVSFNVEMSFSSQSARVGYLEILVDSLDITEHTTAHAAERTELGFKRYRLSTVNTKIDSGNQLCNILHKLKELNEIYKPYDFIWAVEEL